VDWSQNDEHKTTISVYSLRARERPTVSTPVKWEEVEQALKTKDAGSLVFEAGQVLARVGQMGDLFEPVLTLRQKLPNLPGVETSQTGAVEKRAKMGSGTQRGTKGPTTGEAKAPPRKRPREV